HEKWASGSTGELSPAFVEPLHRSSRAVGREDPVCVPCKSCRINTSSAAIRRDPFHVPVEWWRDQRIPMGSPPQARYFFSPGRGTGPRADVSFGAGDACLRIHQVDAQLVLADTRGGEKQPAVLDRHLDGTHQLRILEHLLVPVAHLQMELPVA